MGRHSKSKVYSATTSFYLILNSAKMYAQFQSHKPSPKVTKGKDSIIWKSYPIYCSIIHVDYSIQINQRFFHNPLVLWKIKNLSYVLLSDSLEMALNLLFGLPRSLQ